MLEGGQSGAKSLAKFGPKFLAELPGLSRDPGFPLENTKSRPPRKSPKISQKLQFGPPQACPENYRKITRKCNFFTQKLLKNYTFW